MSTLSTSGHAVKPKTRKPLAPVHGKARLLAPVGAVNDRTGQIAIDGKPYYLELTGHGYRLVGWDGRKQAVTVYDLPLTLDACDCPDATYASERPEGCKHRKALAALLAKGVIPPAHDELSVPDPDELPEPCGSWFDADEAA